MMQGTNPIPDFRADCPCTKKKCKRHGLCADCHAYHAEGKHLPYCLRKQRPGDFAWGSFSPPPPRGKKRR